MFSYPNTRSSLRRTPARTSARIFVWALTVGGKWFDRQFMKRIVKGSRTSRVRFLTKPDAHIFRGSISFHIFLKASSDSPNTEWKLRVTPSFTFSWNLRVIRPMTNESFGWFAQCRMKASGDSPFHIFLKASSDSPNAEWIRRWWGKRPFWVRTYMYRAGYVDTFFCISKHYVKRFKVLIGVDVCEPHENARHMHQFSSIAFRSVFVLLLTASTTHRKQGRCATKHLNRPSYNDTWGALFYQSYVPCFVELSAGLWTESIKSTSATVRAPTTSPPRPARHWWRSFAQSTRSPTFSTRCALFILICYCTTPFMQALSHDYRYTRHGLCLGHGPGQSSSEVSLINRKVCQKHCKVVYAHLNRNILI